MLTLYARDGRGSVLAEAQLDWYGLEHRHKQVGDLLGSAEAHAALDDYARRLWKIVEAAAGRPWFLGSRFSAIDVYMAVMTRWRPGRDWFKKNTERLHAIAHALNSEARLSGAWRRNFDPGS